MVHSVSLARGSLMFTVDALHKLLGRLVADGAGQAVVVFRSPHSAPLGLRPGIFSVDGLIPSSVEGEGTALVIDNSQLEGGEGKPLCIVACHPFNRRVRFIPLISGRYKPPIEPLGASRSHAWEPGR
jgi:hypothetical protein